MNNEVMVDLEKNDFYNFAKTIDEKVAEVLKEQYFTIMENAKVTWIDKSDDFDYRIEGKYAPVVMDLLHEYLCDILDNHIERVESLFWNNWNKQ